MAEEKHPERPSVSEGVEGQRVCYNLNMWYVYIIETKAGHLYTGTTNDVPRRENEHKEGKGARYTRIFGFKKLLYQEECPTKSHALKREKQIQGWTRKKKMALIKGDLKLLKKL